jgi:hypothetical protein
LTSGSVWLIGMTSPSCSGPALRVPGLSSATMSFRPVFGRSSTVALRYTRSYLGSIRSVTSALPSRSSTFEISPIATPATFTVWPCPGVTACAVAIWALTTKKSLPMTGTQPGSTSRSLERITAPTASATTIRTRTATKSRRCLRIAVLTASPYGA